MMQKKRIEPRVAVEDHGGLFAMGTTPFVPVRVMAVWQQGIVQHWQGTGIFFMNYGDHLK